MSDMKLFCSLMGWLTVALSGTVLHAADAQTPPASNDLKVPAVIFDEEVLKTFAALPVLDSGRVKPLDTVARFRLLNYHGKQSIKVEGNETLAAMDKEKLSAIEWLLLSWFAPEVAKQLPLFVVDNSEAVVELGLPAKGPRDRYSYNEIQPAINMLLQKMQEIGSIDEKMRTPSQRYLAKLGVDFFDYTLMVGQFDFARAPFGQVAGSVPKELIPDPANPPRLSEILPKIGDYIRANPQLLAPMMGEPQPWLEQFSKTLMTGRMSRNPEQTLRIFPPSEKEDELWQSPGSVMQAALEGGAVIGEAQTEEFKQWENLYFVLNDAATFKTKLQEFSTKVTEAASVRGEDRFLDMEVSYHKRDYMTNALVFFILGLLTLGLSWASPTSAWGKWMVRLCWLSMLIGAAYVTTGIVIRCIIMQRPPVATLYETILFITSAAVILCLIAELLVVRKGIALLVAALSGTVGMYLSIRYMNMEGTDTMQQLQAVLLTNFWLATHVPIINLGYAAGMVSAIFAMIYFIMRVLVGIGLMKESKGIHMAWFVPVSFASFLLARLVKSADHDSTDARRDIVQAKDLTRISYGFVMAGLFLSLVGTILGGIWANYSWGRFWGWDPKENGALLIVLMNLIILHARLGGFIREVGFHACCIILGMIVVFSWFGTNQLGVGLHSYGFTDGIWFKLMMFWASQLVFLLIALVLWFTDKKKGTKNDDKKRSASGRLASSTR